MKRHSSDDHRCFRHAIVLTVDVGTNLTLSARNASVQKWSAKPGVAGALAVNGLINSPHDGQASPLQDGIVPETPHASKVKFGQLDVFELIGRQNELLRSRQFKPE